MAGMILIGVVVLVVVIGLAGDSLPQRRDDRDDWK